MPAPTPTPAYAQVDVVVAGFTFRADVADTAALRALGLGGRDSLPANRAMWFVFDAAAPRQFWMRRMRFPLDIVWVSDGYVVTGVAERVPHPAPGTPLSQLRNYSSIVPVRYVLEINAGLAGQLGIVPGSRVSVAPR